MKTEFYSKRNLDFKEKRNRLGRFMLFLGFFISTFLTLAVAFFMIINNLGISPSDEHGFKGVRPDVAHEIIKNFKHDVTNDRNISYSISYKNNVLSSVEINETPEEIKYVNKASTSSFELTLNNLDKTFEIKSWDSPLKNKVKTYEEGLALVQKEYELYLSNYSSYNSTYYSSIMKSDKIRYYYNEQRKHLKYALPSGAYLIVNEEGKVLKGVVNIRGEENPLLYEVTTHLAKKK